MTTKCNLRELIFLKTSEEKRFLNEDVYRYYRLSHASIKRFLNFDGTEDVLSYEAYYLFTSSHILRSTFRISRLRSEWLPLCKRLHYESAFHFISRLVLEIQHVERMTTCFRRKYEKNWSRRTSKSKI